MNPKQTFPLAKLLEQVDNLREEAIELQRQLTRIPALSPESGGDGDDNDGGGNGNAEIVLVRVFAGVPLDAPVDFENAGDGTGR
ncbi:hypothetical protein FBQ85_25675, partial [Cytophagia bacterium CHB2]|nr:hypothetical protein [Cytophagia bacterium CHB2]